MKVYLYAKSGHSVGLEATRICAAISNELKEFDPILCTCDFRAGAYAKDELGIKKYVSVDVLSNLPNMLRRGDILIYDTDEASDFMENHMEDFCTHLYKVGSDIPASFINTELFNPQENQNIQKAFYFGDDDYNDRLLDICKNQKKHDIVLQMGHYFFLGNEKNLINHFEELREDEEYVNTICNSKFLLTTSLNSVYESIACGNKPVLLKREDKIYNEAEIKALNIPTIELSSLDEIIDLFNKHCENYPKISVVKNFDLSAIKNDIKKSVLQYNKLNNIQ